MTIEAISEVVKEPHTFVWVGLHDADPSLLLKIQEEFDLHELAIEDIALQMTRLHPDMIPKEMNPYFRDVHDLLSHSLKIHWSPFWNERPPSAL